MRAQKALMRIFVPAKALTPILTTRSMAALAPCELTQVLHGVAGCSAAHVDTRRACFQQACGIYVQAAHGCLCC